MAPFRIAILWRGDREARRTASAQNNRYHRIFEELSGLGIHAEPAVYDEEFADGLALGQLAPGPPLMLAAFIGFKLFGIAGAAVAGAAIFLPSFLMILSILSLLQRMKDLQWLRAFMRGVAPAVIGALAVSLVQIAPHAAPDVFTWILMALTVGVILLRNVGPLPLVASGAVIGLLAKNEFVERLAEWAWSYAQKLVTG